MTTAKQAATNRANARHSTGPKTEAGRQASAANAFKHGLSANNYLRHDEDPASFDAFYATLRALYERDDAVIDDLVFKIAMAHWRLDRSLRTEAVLIEDNSLADVITCQADPVKTLIGYEAMARKTLKQLEDSLMRYRDLRKAAASSSEVPAAAEPPRPRVIKPRASPDKSHLVQPSVTAEGSNRKTNPISTMDGEPVLDLEPAA
jgi:hypothetical protein